MDLTRRYFLSSSALALFGIGLVPSFLRRTAFARERKPASGTRRVLVVIFMRGAADGLNIVVPHGEGEYYALRPTIAVPRSGASSLFGSGSKSDGRGVIDLDGFFGLHPSLAPLKPLYDARELAVIHAVGSPDNTRSHFDAQDAMESATPGSRAAADGWLNRYLQATPRTDATPFRAVAIAQRMPRTLQGRAPVLVMDDLRGFRLFPERRNAEPLRRQAESLQAALEQMYGSTADPIFAKSASEMFQAMHSLDRAGLDLAPPDSGAGYPPGPFGKALFQTSQLIKSGLGLELAFVEIGGWDHHVNEGGVDGQLARNLEQLGKGLSAFRRDLGERFENVVVLTMSEFGRTAHENGNRGTDHGHANLMFALGGPVRGGKVYGKWPGLKPDQLFEGRDLALTTDFRDVFNEAVVRHLELANPASVFPGFAISPSRFRGFLA